MNESAPGELPPGSTDVPTPEQSAILQYMGLTPADGMTSSQAGALISRAESDPASREKLQAWHREKYRLHPGLFAPPQRSFREARWWQAKISDDQLYGYSFQQPSLSQTLVILESLDRQEPGWEQENNRRREARFMNELATLSPELCKPGCTFPHDLPTEDSPEEPSPASPAIRAPSAPFVPSQYAAQAMPFTPPSKPAWQPPVQPPVQTQAAVGDREPVTARGGGGGKWAVLAVVLAAGAGAYYYLGPHAPGPGRDNPANPPVTSSLPSAKPPTAGSSPSSNGPAPVAAKESRQRAVAKYPDLAQAGSALNTKFVAAFRQLDSEHSPLLQQPDWPERLADQCVGVRPPPPAVPKNTLAAPPPVVGPQAAAAPVATAAPAVPAATPLPASALFVSLEADYKDKLNTVRYHQHGASQEAGVFVKIRSMMHGDAKFMVRCVFFKRPTGRGDLRVVLSKNEKSFVLPAGQTYSDAFDSPPVYRGPHATEEFDGWLVQLIPEGSDKFLKQIGSTGTIEELGKTTKF